MPDSKILKMEEPAEAKTTAAGDMRSQFEQSGSYMYNADRMWRRVGRPKGRSPEVWLEKAAPLVTGLQGYFANLDGLPEDHDFNDEVLSLASIADDEVGMRIGDQLMTFMLAMAYARFLDAEPEWAGSLS